LGSKWKEAAVAYFAVSLTMVSQTGVRVRESLFTGTRPYTISNIKKKEQKLQKLKKTYATYICQHAALLEMLCISHDTQLFHFQQFLN
jgi:hypothetical protein